MTVTLTVEVTFTGVVIICVKEMRMYVRANVQGLIFYEYHFLQYLCKRLVYRRAQCGILTKYLFVMY